MIVNVPGVVIAVAGLLLAVPLVGLWQGRFRPAPHSLLARGYLLLGIPVALVALGVLIAIGDNLRSPAGEAMGGVLATIAALAGLVSVVLVAWQPRRLRPDWLRAAEDDAP